jgi:hypothetical protein
MYYFFASGLRLRNNGANYRDPYAEETGDERERDTVRGRFNCSHPKWFHMGSCHTIYIHRPMPTVVNCNINFSRGKKSQTL